MRVGVMRDSKLKLRNLNVSDTLGFTTNKLETPKEKDEVNKREVHECDGRPRDPDTVV